MKSSKAFIACDVIPPMKTKSRAGSFFKISAKNWLDAAKTAFCAGNWWPSSETRVTSEMFSARTWSLKDFSKFCLKSFQLTQSSSSLLSLIIFGGFLRVAQTNLKSLTFQKRVCEFVSQTTDSQKSLKGNSLNRKRRNTLCPLKKTPVLLCERVGARLSPNDNPGWTGGTPPSRHSPPTSCATLSITLNLIGEIHLGQFEKYIFEPKKM